MKASKFLIWLACVILGLYGCLTLALTRRGVAVLLGTPQWSV